LRPDSYSKPSTSGTAAGALPGIIGPICFDASVWLEATCGTQMARWSWKR
jgi:hypothetical protein